VPQITRRSPRIAVGERDAKLFGRVRRERVHGDDDPHR
jgi:hypothetical protein